MKRILFLSILLSMAISLSACTSKGIHSTINNPTGERLYPYKITTDSGKSFKYGYINKQGKIIIKAQYDFADFFDNGSYRVKINNKWGMMDTEGNIIIKPIYQNLSGLSDNLIAAELNGKYGYIDIKGNTIIPFQYNQADDFSEGKACVFKGTNQFIDTKGNAIAKNIDYANVGGFKNGYATIASVDLKKFGYIDKNFNIIIKPQYAMASYFINGTALVCESSQKFYLINTKGQKITEFPEGYTLIGETDDGKLFLVRKNNKSGYMDLKGNIIIDCTFDTLDIFINGYAIASKDGKTCVIDTKGKIITDSLPDDHMKIGIIDDLVVYDSDNGTEYYTLTGKKIFSSISK